MKPGKKRRLEKMGWKVGTVDEFLNLTPEDEFAAPEDVPAPEWQLNVIRERLALYERHESARPWPEVRVELLTRLRGVKR